jgi:hypothetical protein
MKTRGGLTMTRHLLDAAALAAVFALLWAVWLATP